MRCTKEKEREKGDERKLGKRANKRKRRRGGRRNFLLSACVHIGVRVEGRNFFHLLTPALVLMLEKQKKRKKKKRKKK